MAPATLGDDLGFLRALRRLQLGRVFDLSGGVASFRSPVEPPGGTDVSLETGKDQRQKRGAL
jgi:hypothetical protein